MMRLTVAALIAVWTFGTVVSTQAPTQQQQASQPAEPVRLGPAEAQDRVNELLGRLRRQQEARLDQQNRCALPDGTVHRVNTVVTFRGWRYRCVEVLGSQLERIGAGWARLPESEQD